MTTYVANSPLVNYFFYNAPTIQGGPNVPLDGGKIYFYADEDHDVQLNTWEDVYDPNNPVVNPWPLVLGAAGECPIIYMEERFYYIEIYDKNNVFQRSISHYFPGDGFSGSANDAKNYIPNGQFLLHYDLPATEDYEAGEIRAAVTDIAYGGWTFERPESSTAKDFVTFERYDDYTTNPSGNPRYAVRIQCTESDSGDAYKQLCVKFPNVNRFASATQQYTVGFTGLDLLDNDVTVELYIIKNFGTDGSPQEETLIETFNLNATTTSFYKSFVYGANTGKIISDEDDDFVQLAFKFKTDEEFDLKITDCMQESGNIVSPNYPETTNRDDISAALGGGFPVPAYDGSDLYLYPILTPTGWAFDDSQVGFIYASSLPDIPAPYIQANGEQYETASTFSTGVPCSRLQAKYLNRSNDEICPRYGTGRDFVTAITTNETDSLLVINNKVGTATNFSNGTPSPGFTFTDVASGSVDTHSWGLFYGTQSFYIYGKNAGQFSAPGIDAATSGFTVLNVRNPPIGTDVASVTLTRCLFSVETVAAASLAGKYFEFVNNTTLYYVWFKVDGVGVDPAPGGGAVGIEVNLLSPWDAPTVAKVIAAAVSGFKVTNIKCVAANLIPAGSYFNLNTATQEFYVWFQIDGAGTDPAPPGKISIVDGISSSWNAAQVKTNTIIQINSKYFSVPDLRGFILKGWSDTSGIDLDAAYRWSFFNNVIAGNYVGSYQFDDITQHFHYILNISEEGFQTSASPAAFVPQGGAGGFLSEPSGGSESRPLNMYVNYLIKY